MILSRYRYNVTMTHRRPPFTTVTDRYRPLPTVTDRYRPLPTVTDRYRILPLFALQALPALHFNKTLNACSNTLYYDQ
jgi:hypothetical protein